MTQVEDYSPERWDVVEIDLNSNLTLNKLDQIALLSYTDDFQVQAILQVLLLLPYSFESSRFRLVVLKLLPQESHGVHSAPVWCSTNRRSS